MLASRVLTLDDTPQPERAHNRQSVIEARGLAFLVGFAAVAMPLVMLGSNALSLFEATKDLVCFQDSISHYYYAQVLGDVFVISLAAIGVILIAFRGDSEGERTWSTVAGVGALGVALVPTTENGCDAGAFAGRVQGEVRLVDGATEPILDAARYFGASAAQDYIHFAFAASVFLTTLVFCFRLFLVVNPWHRKDGAITPIKARRNDVYKSMGRLIAFSLVAIVANVAAGRLGFEIPYWDRFNGTFVFESLALGAFGYAWLVRGRFISRYDDPEELDRRADFLNGKAA